MIHEGRFAIDHVDPEWERRVYGMARRWREERRRERSLRTRLVCALWWNHRPVRTRPYTLDFARDYLTCRCGRVTDTAQNVVVKLR